MNPDPHGTPDPRGNEMSLGGRTMQALGLRTGCLGLKDDSRVQNEAWKQGHSVKVVFNMRLPAPTPGSQTLTASLHPTLWTELCPPHSPHAGALTPPETGPLKR